MLSQIVPELSTNKNIALFGKIGSGKTTLARNLVLHQNKLIFSFASEVKKIASIYLKRAIDKSTDRELLQDIGQILKIPIKSMSSRDMSVLREWLEDNDFSRYYQKVLNVPGTKIHTSDFYVWSLFESTAFQSALDAGNVVIDDARFVSESLYLKDAGFLLIKLDVPDNERIRRLKSLYGDFKDSVLYDRSELEVDKCFTHYTITTNTEVSLDV